MPRRKCQVTAPFETAQSSNIESATARSNAVVHLTSSLKTHSGAAALTHVILAKLPNLSVVHGEDQNDIVSENVLGIIECHRHAVYCGGPRDWGESVHSKAFPKFPTNSQGSVVSR